MKPYCLLIIAILFFVYIAQACQKSNTSIGGGETNWLKKCTSDAECSKGISCECGICTKNCQSADDCTEVRGASSCLVTESLDDGSCRVAAMGESEQGICVARCENDSDCNRDSDFKCISGVCTAIIEEKLLEAGDAETTYGLIFPNSGVAVSDSFRLNESVDEGGLDILPENLDAGDSTTFSLTVYSIFPQCPCIADIEPGVGTPKYEAYSENAYGGPEWDTIVHREGSCAFEGYGTYLSPGGFKDMPEYVEETRYQGLFTAESEISTEEDTYTIIETRSFDSAGRLNAAELQFPQYVPWVSIPILILNRRLQIDYDSTGRPVLVRLGPMFRMTKNESKGSVVRIEYQSDGSSNSRYVTNETKLLRSDEPLGYTLGPTTGEGYSCEELHFDRFGNLLSRTWDCVNPTVVQSRKYDGQNRVVSDRGELMYDHYKNRPVPIQWDDVMQIGEWEIDFAYDDANRTSTTIWKEYDQNRYKLVYGLYASDEKVEHRLVRTFDDSGQRVLIADYDFGNDGDYNEQTIYTYQERELLSKEIDLWRDGVVDIIEIHTRSVDSHRVERRNMIASTDEWFSSVFVDEWTDSFTGTSAKLPSQSQAITEITYDEESRPIAIELEMNWLYSSVPEGTNVWKKTPVSESWRETVVYAEKGYIEEKRLCWEPSDELLLARSSDTYWETEPTGSRLFSGATANTTSCTLTPLCPNADITLPEDMRLLTCEVAFIFPEYQNVVDIPSINRDDYSYVVPPYDAVPGIQNAIKRHHQIYGFPGPPNVRDIIDY